MEMEEKKKRGGSAWKSDLGALTANLVINLFYNS